MKRFFAELGRTRVRLTLPGRRAPVWCPMLPVGRLDEWDECAGQLMRAADRAATAAVRRRMVALIRSVWPATPDVDWDRLSPDRLVEVLNRLMLGDGEAAARSRPEPGGRGRPDGDRLVGRIVRNFGWLPEEVMRLNFPAFCALVELLPAEEPPALPCSAGELAAARRKMRRILRERQSGCSVQSSGSPKKSSLVVKSSQSASE